MERTKQNKCVHHINQTYVLMILNNAHANLVVDGDGLMNAIAVNTMKDFSLKKTTVLA